MTDDDVLKLLNELMPKDSNKCLYRTYIGSFLIRIQIFYDLDSIAKFTVSDVYLYELDKNGVPDYISLNKDNRFSNYKPIKYNKYGSNEGNDMPLKYLIELIKYLYRLNDLSIFT